MPLVDGYPVFMPLDLLLWICAGIVTMAGAGGVLHRLLRKPIAKAKEWFDEQSRAAQTLNGYGPIVDPTTGEVLQEAVPGIAKRVSVLESLATQLAQSHLTATQVTERVQALEEWRETHDEWATQAHREVLRRLGGAA